MEGSVSQMIALFIIIVIVWATCSLCGLCVICTCLVYSSYVADGPKTKTVCLQFIHSADSFFGRHLKVKDTTRLDSNHRGGTRLRLFALYICSVSVCMFSICFWMSAECGEEGCKYEAVINEFGIFTLIPEWPENRPDGIGRSE